ncbi:MAG: VIT1/CCC1 transporter family protein [Anaerolineae bacterium]|nr:VIT1/CCC1 transporter family protein [Anaerolineae bacterium]
MTTSNLTQYRANWQDEIDSAALYSAIAEIEKQPPLKEVYRRLAVTEQSHVGFWEEKIRAAGAAVPSPRVGWRTRTLIWLAQRFGTGFVIPTIATLEQAGEHTYQKQPETAGTGLAAQERSHRRLLESISGGSGSAGIEGNALARLEGRHRSLGGNALRAAVLGANDGLVSNLSLIMGVAGAELSNQTILITGFAGLLAGAISMALGEWISVQSSRELYQRQLGIEASEIEHIPDEEQQELALIYEAKGLPKEQAQALATRLMSNRETALDTLSREELGLDPEELGGSAWEAAAVSFFLFSIGAIVPLLPFVFFQGITAVIVSAVASALGLFLIGSAITLMTGRSIWYSGTRQAVFGLIAAGVTYGIGRLLGVSVSG